tara:strand:- start:20581 stop:21186 length:606 start_codon:yes stop_codon:yes gene_type:complete
LVFSNDDIEGIWDFSWPGHGIGHPPSSSVDFTTEGKLSFDSFLPELDPTLKCLMPGIPLGIIDPYPIEIVMQDHQILFLYEHFHMVRRIFMDGRIAPDDWPVSLIGYSVGHWEEKTLVIKTTHMSPDNYVWTNGMPFSGDKNSYVIERYSREGDILLFEAEIHDSVNYKTPYKVSGQRLFSPDMNIYEYECLPDFAGAGVI